jgi:hypothetical protein
MDSTGKFPHGSEIFPGSERRTWLLEHIGFYSSAHVS